MTERRRRAAETPDWLRDAPDAEMPDWLASAPDVEAPARPQAPASARGPTRATHPELYGDIPNTRSVAPTALESGLVGAVDAATFGFADEIGGRIASWLPGRGSYEQERNAAREQIRRAREAHPVAFGAGEVGGGLATLALPIGAAAGGATRAAGTAARVGRAARAGAAVGGVSALGHSEAETAGGMARDVALGAGLGAGLSAGAAGIGRALAGARTLAGKAGAAQRVRQLGGHLGDIRRISRAPGGLEGMAGRLREHGFARNLSTLSRNQELAQTLQQRAGQTIRRITQTAGEAAQLEPQRLTQRVQSELLTEMEGNPFAESVRGRISDTLAQLTEQYPDGIPLERAQTIKQWLSREVYGTLGPRGQDTPMTSAMRQFSGILNREIEDTVERAGQRLGDQTLRQQLLQAKNAYRTATQVLDLTNDEMMRRASNRAISLTDTAAGLGGLVVSGGNPLAAAATLGANRALRAIEKPVGATVAETIARIGTPARTVAGRTMQTAATGLRRGIGQATRIGAGSAVATQAPRTSGTVLQQVADRDPDQLGPYAQRIEDAAAQGPEALAATHYELAETDPDYRARLEELEEEREEAMQ